MSTAPVVPVAATPAATPAPAPRPTAIQLIEQELVGFFKQRESAIANVHAVDGAIQGAQAILAKLKNEIVKAEAEAKRLVAEAESKVKELATAVETDVKADVTKAEQAVEKI